MNPKLKKLVSQPRQFFVDFAKKRARLAALKIPSVSTTTSPIRYTIVAAVYGVEAYLPDFLSSIAHQSLSFERNIQVVLVNDGSPDRCGEIIDQWIARYPRADVRHIRQENAGQGAARNHGIRYATGDWVTFADPDDFFDRNYFACVDRFLRSREPGLAPAGFVACNLIYFREATQRFDDTHPLRFRFKAGDHFLADGDLGRYIHLPVNSAFFRTDHVVSTGIEFDSRVRPNFEDGHFVARYLMSLSGSDLGFCASARYFYRKRLDESSALDRSWTDPRRFLDVVEHGYLDLLRAATADYGSAPRWLQRTVLYEVQWMLRKFVNGQTQLGFLTTDQQTSAWTLLEQCFVYIDDDVILGFDLARTWWFFKAGMLSSLKGVGLPFYHVYIESFDPIERHLEVRYFYDGDAPPHEWFDIDGSDTVPIFAKTRVHSLFDRTFLHERILWLPVPTEGNRFQAEIGDCRTRVVPPRGSPRSGGVTLGPILQRLAEPRRRKASARVAVEHQLSGSPPFRDAYRDCLIFMDRDTQADDNAEHLYRYVMEFAPHLNCYFVLRRSSHDWSRLEAEGFRLLDYGTSRHRMAMMRARHLISSHADHYVLYPFDDRAYQQHLRYRFTFLQHGTIKHDLSAWLNSKPIDRLITSTEAEYASIAGDPSPYRFTEREVVLTGLPRHDRLLQREARAARGGHLLAIMPTWRNSLVGRSTGEGNEREVNPAFYESTYAKAWRSLLHNRRLHDAVVATGYRVCFFPHANVAPYMDWFDLPEHIEVRTHRDGGIQDVFVEMSILLTDYSSVDFEAGFLGKQVVYYQFDRGEFYRSGHVATKGYFDYHRDGFGPVVTDEVSLVHTLRGMMSRDGPEEPFRQRMEGTFPYRDGGACARVLEAIFELDRRGGRKPGTDEATRLREAARSASQAAAWGLARDRWLRVLGDGGTEVEPSTDPEAWLALLVATAGLGWIEEGLELADRLRGAPSVTTRPGWFRALAELARLLEEPDEAVGHWRTFLRGPGGERGVGWLGLLQALHSANRLEEARTALGEGPRDAPELDRSATWTRLEAAIHEDCKDWAGAVSAWSRVRELEPAERDALLQLALAEENAGLFDEAMEHATEYIESDGPRHVEARRLRLRLRRASGSLEVGTPASG